MVVRFVMVVVLCIVFSKGLLQNQQNDRLCVERLAIVERLALPSWKLAMVETLSAVGCRLVLEWQ